MPSNYKPIGQFIRLVDERNRGLHFTKLLGLSISKKFIPSVANIIGTDMENYKIIRNNQFACSTMQVRRDKKMPVALYRETEPAIISQAYPIFEIIDEDELSPEYLMMWFSRTEFDREACFHAVGGVRGSLEWEDFIDMKLPLASLETQHEIVREYKVIQNRIGLNNQLIKNLEEAAQTIYKRWFVDFEFLDEEGKPYKSNGGEMVWCEELQNEIPSKWSYRKLGDMIESFSKRHNFKKDNLIFFNTSDILNGEFLHENYMKIVEMPGQAKKQIQFGDILYSEIRPANKRFAIVRVDADDYVVSTKLMVLRQKDSSVSAYRIYHLLTEDSFILELQQSAEGRSGTFPQITYEEDLESKTVIIANKEIEEKWEKFLNGFYEHLFSRKDEIRTLKKIKEMVLARMVKVEIKSYS